MCQLGNKNKKKKLARKVWRRGQELKARLDNSWADKNRNPCCGLVGVEGCPGPVMDIWELTTTLLIGWVYLDIIP